MDQELPQGLPTRKPVIGLNTGCAPRWATRLWAFDNWKELAIKLRERNYEVLLLGGPDEHERNQALAEATGAVYLGHFPLPKFIRIAGECDVIVSAVTMAMHIAIGLRKRLVLFNNIFNRHEFELYNRGEILEPDPPCECTFPISCDKNCMMRITPDRVLEAVERQVAALQ
jgi:heptosyltransferase-2